MKSIPVDEETYMKVEHLAKRMQRSLSEMLRELVEHYYSLKVHPLTEYDIQSDLEWTTGEGGERGKTEGGEVAPSKHRFEPITITGGEKENV